MDANFNFNFNNFGGKKKKLPSDCPLWENDAKADKFLSVNINVYVRERNSENTTHQNKSILSATT